jgi:rhodanese-related sulfurtransferase
MPRDQRRFEMAHIEGSISFETLEVELTTLSRSAEIVLYCTHAACVASKLRAGMLAEAGFTNVSRFAGGLTEWSAAGLPVRQGVPQPA